ncbi:MAG: 23S rRNA (adenine(2503)-C(2))-methyltransferase RlmN [Patescibacteria group bacterium]
MFSEIIKQQGWSKYREKQINRGVFVELVNNWQEITSLPREIRDYLDDNVPFCSLKLVREQVSKNNDTVKALFELADGNMIESVLMMHADRNTVCVSSQVGCPVGCTFCATGAMGFKRNLTSREIVDQVLWWARKARNFQFPNPSFKKISNDQTDTVGATLAVARNGDIVGADQCVRPDLSSVGAGSPRPSMDIFRANISRVNGNTAKGGETPPQRVNNIVFMGMGEPMMNLENVADAITVLTDKEKFGISKRKITISTSGYIANLDKLLKQFPHIGLAISLHAPTQELREKIMPTAAKNNPLDKLIDLVADYSRKTKRRVSFEYILIEKVNDDLIQAQQLAKLLSNKGFLFHVNLIAFNADKKNGAQKYSRPNSQRVNFFRDELIKLKVPVSIRSSMGEDIAAACGQLANN